MYKLILRQGSSRREILFEGPVSLRTVLEDAGIIMAHPCGGRGVCGRCHATLIAPYKEEILTCQYVLHEDCEVLLPTDGMKMGVEITLRQEKSEDASQVDPGIAIDIGTTTLAAALVDKKSGKVLAVTGRVNPQTEIAADVISRIAASMGGQREYLQKQILTALDAMAEELKKKADVSLNKKVPAVITGNTTMLYLLTGEDPEPLSHAPFEADDLFGREQDLGLTQIASAYLPPCMDAFVGADITCAVQSSGMTEQKGKTNLLCDIGTNGEVALYKDDTLYVTSTAAGPAFESIGVFGSELIDALAGFLDEELMDETGLIDEDYDGKLPINDHVDLTQKDVRTVQLAKAAIRAGLETVMASMNVTPADIHCLYIAGGFGAHLNLRSAVRIGLIPEELKAKTKVIGNASLAGAVEMLTDDGKVVRAETVAKKSVHVELGGNAMFNDLYIEKMLFETSLRDKQAGGKYD